MYWREARRPIGSALLLWGIIFACTHGVFAEEDVSATVSSDSNEWVEVPTTGAPQGLLTDVINVDGRLIAVGAYGTILLSKDGHNWLPAETGPIDVTLTSVFFLDTETGWAVGHDATILHTTNGGQAWNVQYANPELETPLMSLVMTSSDRGLAVGAFGLAIETRDGGATWKERPLMSGRIEDFHLNGVFRGLSKDLVFVVAESGFVYRSIDRGHTFLQIRTPVTESFWRGQTLDDGMVLIVGESGQIQSSRDLGATWTEIDSGSIQGVSGVAELNDGRIVVAGSGGYLAESADRGKNFKRIFAPEEDFTSAAAGPGGLIVLTGKHGLTVLTNRRASPNRLASN